MLGTRQLHQSYKVLSKRSSDPLNSNLDTRREVGVEPVVVDPRRILGRDCVASAEFLEACVVNPLVKDTCRIKVS